VPLSGEGFVPFYYCEDLLAAYLQVDPSTLLYSPIIHINHLGELPAPAPLGTKLASGLFEFETLNGEDAFTTDVTIGFWTYSSPNEIEVLWLDSDTQTWNTPHGNLNVNRSDGHITIETDTLGVYAAFRHEVSVVIDDFESYTDNVELGEAVWQTWTDGKEDPNNGSQVGYDEPPIMETEIVHSGRQSMPFFYTNNEGVTESVAYRTFDPPMDWSRYDILSLLVHGYPNNTGGDFFIQVNCIRAYNIVDLSEAEWLEVEIDLDTLDTDLETIATLGIGVDGNDTSGIIYIDGISGICTPQPIEPNTFIIDDFESYTDNTEEGEAVWQTWIDGLEDPNNGSQVGYLEPPFAELEIVHSGRQSMPFFYNNIEDVTESVASRTFEPPMEWKAYDTVTVWIFGYQDNTGRNFFIQVNNKRAYQNVDLSKAEWQKVEFILNTLFTDTEMVKSLCLGVDGNYINGIIYIDDIELDLTISTE